MYLKMFYNLYLKTYKEFIIKHKCWYNKTYAESADAFCLLTNKLSILLKLQHDEIKYIKWLSSCSFQHLTDCKFSIA